jgi:uncharacterized protein (TIGR00255 family)
MTGFGAGRANEGADEFTVEARSVNHKFSEVKIRLPRELSALEQALAKAVKDRIVRGSVEVQVRRAATAETRHAPVVDVALAREYRRAIEDIARATGASPEVRAYELALQPGVLRLEEQAANLERVQPAVLAALSQALDALGQMRQQEGGALEVDILARLRTVERLAGEIAQLAPQVVEEYRARLADRVAELSRGTPVDPQRLAQEVAFFAERTDIAEEITRLSSHLVQFKALVVSEEPAGRKMDFLVQEMNREVNTTGSKSQHPEISTRVVAMKAEIERIREQVQNVE